MRGARQERPWPILIFAGITTYLATMGLWEGLSHLSGTIATLNGMLPFLDWNRDLAIIYTSAWFTIDMIPVILVLVFAVPFARSFISAMSLVPIILVLTNLEYASTYPRFLVPSIVMALFPVALAGLLWTKPANRYFAKEGENHAQST